jgi:RHS repeat-associated protein
VYKPFGEADVNPNSSVVNNHRFPGQYYDLKTGLHYNYHRYYDPNTGRYIRTDPIGLSGGMNLYPYAANSPITWTDRFGLKPGDIYLFTMTQGYAKLIGALSTGGKYGHAAIEIPGGQLLTAEKSGVRMIPINEALKNTEYDIYRPKRNICEYELAKFALEAYHSNTEGYNWSGLIGIQIITPSDVSNPYYIQKEYTCAEIVWWASLYSGNFLGMMGTQISPNEISKSFAVYKLQQ